jgi:8-amino-7-oxononanoate synthase
MPALLALALAESLRILRTEDNRRAHLSRLIEMVQRGIEPSSGTLLSSQTAIQPLVLGSAAEAVRRSQALAERGLLVPAVRPPTVPNGAARLRISLSAAHEVEDIERLLGALRDSVR